MIMHSVLIKIMMPRGMLILTSSSFHTIAHCIIVFALTGKDFEFLVEAQLKHQTKVHSEVHLLADAAPAIRNGLEDGLKSKGKKKRRINEVNNSSSKGTKAVDNSSADGGMEAAATTPTAKPKMTMKEQKEAHLVNSVEAVKESLETEGGLLVRGQEDQNKHSSFFLLRVPFSF